MELLLKSPSNISNSSNTWTQATALEWVNDESLVDQDHPNYELLTYAHKVSGAILEDLQQVTFTWQKTTSNYIAQLEAGKLHAVFHSHQKICSSKSSIPPHLPASKASHCISSAP